MDRQTVESMLVKLAVLCKKAIFQTTSGYEAEYAAAIGKETQETLKNLNSYSSTELSNIVAQVKRYMSEMYTIISA